MRSLLMGGDRGTIRTGACRVLMLVGAISAAGCSAEIPIGQGNGEAGAAGGSKGGAGGAAQGGSQSSGAQGGRGGSGGRGGAGGGAAFAGGAGLPSSAGAGGESSEPGDPDFGGSALARASKLDLLLVVDNSANMATKQEVLTKALPAFLERLVNPACVGSRGSVRVADAQASCPAGTAREFAPLTDLHVGVITTSLGSFGGQICNENEPRGNGNDRARLLGSVRDVPSWNDSGFAKWDASGSTPGAAASLDALLTEVTDMARAVGSDGCGYEASLEAWYHFLVDPEPWQTIPAGADSGELMTQGEGIDEVLLAQRAEFLRPDSAVAILMLSDENDCSIIDHGQGWLIGTQTFAGNAFRMPKATSACAADPNDVCCRSCATPTDEAACAPAAEDPACDGTSLSPVEDNLNLRCWDQKRRFGFDLLQPVNRYIRALTQPKVPRRDGTLVRNPLFPLSRGASRRPNLVTFGTIVGVPWQDISAEESLAGGPLRFLSASELAAQERWPLITKATLGDDPDDPFMVESAAPRAGRNPLTGERIVASTSTEPLANAINGHEQVGDSGAALQAACIFELAEPIDCAADPVKCECHAGRTPENQAICQPPHGGPTSTTQYFAGATPGQRQLEVVRGIGASGVVGSACPAPARNDPEQDGYAPALRAFGDRVAETLE
ncbi:MAG TPA: hypothetical protein VER33_03540 [Polyangiaceae bacterium]|nr:hypothetical protein [Polyangiaceae bacterium]